MPLTVAEDRFGAPAPVRFAIAFGFKVPEAMAEDGPVATVVVNNGRWIARCPFCRGAELAARTDERFLCGSCLNRTADGRWIPARLPDNSGEIEEVLLRRPDPRTRGWEVHETVADLLAENDAHGIDGV